MAEVTGLRHNALPYPIYGLPWGIVIPLLDADGDLVTGASTPDSEVSKNGDTFADCTNEMVEIATASGMYYLLLTGTEMTADVVAIIAKSATAGMKTTPVVLYPRKLVTLRSGTVGANAADGTTLQLDSSAVAVDDYYNGCVLVGTLDSTTEVRIIGDYVGSTKVCTVKGPAFNLAPDTTDTFEILLPEGKQVCQGSTMAWNDVVVSTPATAGIPDVNVKNIDNDAASASGTVTFPNATLASTTNITAGTITTATNVTTVNGLAANVITAASMAADAGAEIADAVWDEDATGHQTQGTFGQAIGDPVADTNTIFKAVVTDATGATVGVDVVDLKTQIGVAGAGLTAIDLPDQTMNITGNITGNLSGSVGSVTGLTVATISDGVWDEAIAGHLAAGSTGEALSNAGSAGDPWGTALPGAYGAGTAGKIIGDNINATISSRATQVSVDDLPTNAELATALDPLPTAAENAAALLDLADGIETGLTPRQTMRVMAAALGGKASGGGTGTETFRNAAADSKDRIVATVDANGNRTAITLDVT